MARAVIKDFLPRITPEEAGLPSAQVEKFLAHLEESGMNPHAFIISRWGKVFAEAYFAPYDPYELQTVYSLSKSFTSVAVGLAVSEGKLSLHDPVVSFFSEEELPSRVDPKLAGMTVRDLLCMATGQEKECSHTGENWARDFLKEPVVDEKSGTVFRYNSMATYMCAAILKKVGIDAEVYLKEKLLHPLGIYGTRWQRSPQNVITGGWGMSVVPELILKFGNLLLNGGVWEGKQLLPKEYLDQAVSKQIDNVNSEQNEQGLGDDYAAGYGFQFWRCSHNCYRGDGAYAQFCVVSPDTGLVLATTNQMTTDKQQKLLDAFYTYILLPLKEKPLPEDPEAAEHLKKRSENLSALSPAPVFVPNEEAEKKLDGRRLTLDPPQERALLAPEIASLSLSFADGKLCFGLGDTGIRCGQGKWEEQAISLPMPSAQGFDDLKAFGCYTFEGEKPVVRIVVPELLMDTTFTIACEGTRAEITAKQLQIAEPAIWPAKVE